MRGIWAAVCLVPIAIGLAIFSLGVARYRLPYENDRYYDPQTQVVYRLQSAEVYLIIGGAITLVGIGFAFIGARQLVSRRNPRLR